MDVKWRVHNTYCDQFHRVLWVRVMKKDNVCEIVLLLDVRNLRAFHDLTIVAVSI